LRQGLGDGEHTGVDAVGDVKLRLCVNKDAVQRGDLGRKAVFEQGLAVLLGLELVAHQGLGHLALGQLGVGELSQRGDVVGGGIKVAGVGFKAAVQRLRGLAEGAQGAVKLAV